MSKSDTPYFWDVANPKAYNNRMGKYKTRYVLDFISKYTNDRKRILDVGGGSGRFAIPLYEKGADVVLLDESDKAAAILSKRCPGIKCVVESFDQAVFDQEASFDLILMIEVLFYIRDWPRTLAKVRTLLKDNGVFIFTATNRDSWRFLFSRRKEDYTVYSLDKYRELLNEAGFDIGRIEGFLWIPCKVDSDSVAVDVFAGLESMLGLNRFVSQSPWLLFAVQKDMLAPHLSLPLA